MFTKNEKKLMGRTVVVFGTQRHAAIWGLRNNVNPDTIMLAANGGDRIRGINAGPITVVRVPSDVWEPYTHPCTLRVREMEEALKKAKDRGALIQEEILK